MMKLILVILAFISMVNTQFNNNNINFGRFCWDPFTNKYGGYTFSECYYYAGVTNDREKARSLCGSEGSILFYQTRDADFYGDLDKLSKAYNVLNIWVIYYQNQKIKNNFEIKSFININNYFKGWRNGQ